MLDGLSGGIQPHLLAHAALAIAVEGQRCGGFTIDAPTSALERAASVELGRGLGIRLGSCRCDGPASGPSSPRHTDWY
jgi:hypothetical protein